ncbi:MAG: hypothetical protein CMM77_00305 [Rhodospirillaceae bacterium]|nr:hypothetical protein [Rhodospirillaceae bacterium]
MTRKCRYAIYHFLLSPIICKYPKFVQFMKLGISKGLNRGLHLPLHLKLYLEVWTAQEFTTHLSLTPRPVQRPRD